MPAPNTASLAVHAVAFLELLQDAVYITDLQGKVVFWNRAAETMTGYRPEEVMGDCSLFRSAAVERALDVSSCGSSGPRLRGQLAKHRDGSEFPVTLCICPITNENGATMANLCLMWPVGEGPELEHHEVTRLNECLQSYVSRDTYATAQSTARGGQYGECEQLEMTVVFVDIVGFTRYCDEADPVEIRRLLNEFFMLCEVSFLHNHGDIDKLIGDCVMAVFLDPNDAVTAATELLAVLASRNNTARLREQREIHVRIGIHTGTVIRGDIGGASRKDRTVVGDAVNTAARLQQLGDFDALTITHHTYERLANTKGFQEIGTTKLRGKAESLRLYVR